jgi:hypothetical protein
LGLRAAGAGAATALLPLRLQGKPCGRQSQDAAIVDAGEKATAVTAGRAGEIATTYSVRALGAAALRVSGAVAARRYTRNAGAARAVELLIWGAGVIYASAAARRGATLAYTPFELAQLATAVSVGAERTACTGAGPARR